MARITRASVSPEARQRAAKDLSGPRIALPALGPLPLLSVVLGVAGIVASPDLPGRLLGLAGVVLGVYAIGRAEGAARPDPDARGQVRGLQRALYTLLLRRDDGGPDAAALAREAAPPLEPGEAAHEHRRGGGGIPGLRALPVDGLADEGDNEP